MSNYSKGNFNQYVNEKLVKQVMVAAYGDYDGCPLEVSKRAARPAYQFTSLEAGKILGKKTIHGK